MPVQNQYMDNFDVRSHYSDSAAVVATLYSLTSGGGGVGSGAGAGSGGQTASSRTHHRAASVAGPIALASGITTAPGESASGQPNHLHTNSLHRKPDKFSIKAAAAVAPASNCGTLQRTNGYFRSNQSLCSCNADSEIDVNPNRPLYQYSMDRKNKVHTYTCEQNAQILMRLERERNHQRGGAAPHSATGGAAAESRQQTKNTKNHSADNNGGHSLPRHPRTVDYDVKVHDNFSAANYRENDLLGTHQTYLDVDLLPVPPPPIAPINRKPSSSSTSSKSTPQQQQQSHHHKKSTSCKSSVLNCASNCVLETTTPNNSNSNSTPKHTISDHHPYPITTKTTHDTIRSSSDNQYHLKNMAIDSTNSLKSTKRKPLAATFDLLPVGVDDHQTDTDPEDNLFFCHHEPHLQQYMPHCETLHHNQHRHPNHPSNPGNYSMKYNTIGSASSANKSPSNRARTSSTTNYELSQMTNASQCSLNHPVVGGQGHQSALATTYNNYHPSFSHCPHFPNSSTTPHPTTTTTAFKPKSASVNSLSDLQLPFINSLINFDYHPNDFRQQRHHSQHCGADHIDDHRPPHHFSCSAGEYTQFRNTGDLDGSTDLLNDEGRPGSSIDSFYNSKLYLDGRGCKHGSGMHTTYHTDGLVPIQQQEQQDGSNNNIPWRHRQCPSVSGSSSSSTSISRWDPSRHWFAVTSILLIATAAGVAVPLALRVKEAPYEERLMLAKQLLNSVPLIDGHNDLPWNIRKFLHNQLNEFNFDTNLTTVPPWSKSNWSHTDLYRLKEGKVSAQFWAAYVPCEAQHKDAVQLTLEQIDVIIRLTEKYSPQVISCTSTFDIVEAHKNQQLCSLTGVEGGHSLGGSLSVLRTFYSLGVRYMTLTSTCHTPWADSSYADAPKYDIKHGGLTEFGKTIIREMNRLGMIVDLSHVSVGTMRDALAISEAPVIFSHSSAYELCNSSRNVQDNVLEQLVKNRGLVMINFYSKFLTCSENATIDNAVAHINHIKNVAGIDHVGLGAGFDGINFTPKGLEDVSTYPNLFAELLGNGWTSDELTKLAGQNFLRVLAEVEAVRDKKKTEGQRPYEDILNVRLEDSFNCTSS